LCRKSNHVAKSIKIIKPNKWNKLQRVKTLLTEEKDNKFMGGNLLTVYWTTDGLLTVTKANIP